MLVINAKKRDTKLNNNVLREEKKIPAIVYGRGREGIPIEVDVREFEKIYKEAGESTIINLKIEGEKEDYSVLIREAQRDPVNESYLHVDFYQLPMDEEVEVTVPLKFEGVAPAEKELGGVLVKNIHELEIRALPKHLIHSIKVDISPLVSFDDEIKIKDLHVPKEVKIMADPEEIVALVSKAEEEKVEEMAPEETKEKLEEIEVVGKKKQEEETEEGE